MLRDVGILEQLAQARAKGVTAAQAVERCGISRYAAELLLEAGYASGLCTIDESVTEPNFFITPMGTYWLRDELTRINADFNHHVCFQGALHLRKSLLEGRPAGLCIVDEVPQVGISHTLLILGPG